MIDFVPRRKRTHSSIVRPAFVMLGALILLALALMGSVVPASAQTVPEETQDERDGRMQWWREARFGMFIHWGAYAIPAGTWRGERIARSGGEWIMTRASIPIPEYEQIVRQFNPVHFDAEAWVRLAKQAGMKYIVITSKHHDGLSIYDSAVSSYDILDATPFRRDPLKELADAAAREGIRLGFYYSIMDWHHPHAQGPNYPDYNAQIPNPDFGRYVQDYLKPQLRELLTNYGDVAVLWFDGDWIADWTEAYGRELYALARDLQPGVIINNRVGTGRERRREEGVIRGLTIPGHVGDYGTPEQHIPPQGLPGVDWESCMTLNGTWGYKSYDDNWKDTRTLVRTLVDIASKGGNYLLNVGPKADGTIPAPSESRLLEMGAWLQVNGEAIYGTQASPFPEQPDWGRFTRKSGVLYTHIFDWPEDKVLTIPHLDQPPVRAFLLADQEPLEVEQTDQGVAVQLPDVPPSTIATVLVLEMGGESVGGP